jgi:cytochrome b
VHVLAAVFESIQVRDNLPLSMLTGRRKRLPDERVQ